jgi:Na+/H+ antiporter NhaC
MLALINDIILANAADDLANTLKAYIGPILLLIIGAVSITFLFKRQISQFLIFLVIAIFVAIFFYAPDFITAIAQNFQTESGQGGGGGWK